MTIEQQENYIDKNNINKNNIKVRQIHKKNKLNGGMKNEKI